MVTNFLVSAREAIDEAKELTSGENEQLFKLNKNQCKYVVQKLSECEEVLQSVELITDSLAFQRSNAALYKEIYRVVMEALALMKDCCDEQWLKAAAITHQSGIDKSEYFTKAVYELEWCTFTLYFLCLREKTRIAGKESTSFLEPERCDGKLGVFDMFKLERAAQQDRENLRAHLELLTQFDHVCDASKESNDVSGPTEACLAVQLSQSLNTDDVPASTDHPATISMSRTSLWKVYVPYIPQATSVGRGGFSLVHETEWLREKSVTKAFPGHRVEDENTASSDDVPSAALGTHDHPHDMITKVSCNEDNHKKSENYPVPLMDVMYEDLDQFLRKRSELIDDAGPLSIPISVDLMLQIAQGIKSLHDTGFAHRDLKPSNILLQPLAGVPELEYMEGYLIAKVAHFDIPETKKWTGSICSSSHQKPDVVGTLKSTNLQTSMAMIDDETNDDHDATMLPLPSQEDEEDDRFKANDVYDFAMICCELLMTGSEDSMPGGVHKRRRRRGEPFNTRRTSAADDLELPERCPRRLALLLQRCWEKDPSGRPDFREICKELRYIKGLLLTGDQLLLQNVDTQLQTMKPIQKKDKHFTVHMVNLVLDLKPK
ncbi:hypothetical protein BDL97_13G044500 [Sphagnum fallax]|nr:hypothetical protein BDL97_13G044500 [Sphagnum fallax]